MESEGLRHYFGVSFLPVLMAHTRVAELIILHAHSMDHQGRETTLVTATQITFIAGGRRLTGDIEDFCVLCRFLHKKLEGQKMAVFPPCLTVPGLPFLHGLDLFGPMVVKKMDGAKSN